MEVVDAVADDNDLSKAVSLFQDNFNAYPEIDTVVMLESTGGPGAAQVAKEMGKQVRILDIDAVAETIDNIEAGEEWATLAQNFYKRGYESVRMAYEYLTQDGKVQYSQFMNMPCASRRGQRRSRYSWSSLPTAAAAICPPERLWRAVPTVPNRHPRCAGRTAATPSWKKHWMS